MSLERTSTEPGAQAFENLLNYFTMYVSLKQVRNWNMWNLVAMSWTGS